MKHQTIGCFDERAFSVVPQSGDAANIHAGGLLRLKNGARAKSVAAVQRKRMVKNVEYAHDNVAYARLCLTDRQPARARPPKSFVHVARAFEWKQVRLALIDYFALALVHGLLLIGFIRLVQDDAIDPEVMLPQRSQTHAKKSHSKRKPQGEHPSKRSAAAPDTHPSRSQKRD
jgi:hypothetical protein